MNLKVSLLALTALAAVTGAADAIMSVFKKYEDLKFAKRKDGKVSP